MGCCGQAWAEPHDSREEALAALCRRIEEAQHKLAELQDDQETTA